MCARYTLVVPDAELQEHFELLVPPGLSPRFNVAPSQPVAVVGLKPDGTARGLVPMAWGSSRGGPPTPAPAPAR